MKTEFVQNSQDVEETLSNTCDNCLCLLSDVYETDKYGCLEIFGLYDEKDNLIGLLCPECAEIKQNHNVK